jgi:hypothetical protein
VIDGASVRVLLTALGTSTPSRQIQIGLKLIF